MTMTVSEHLLAIKTHLAIDRDYYCVGVRYEDAPRNIGDLCNNSRHNVARDDERDYPEYGTAEYDFMQELDGTCAYNLSVDWVTSIDKQLALWGEDSNAEGICGRSHCYIVAGDMSSNADYQPDEHEILIKNARVLAIIF